MLTFLEYINMFCFISELKNGMNKEEVANNLIEEIESEDGYILQLRVYNKFNEEALNRLLDLLNEYRISIDNESVINRKVASWLYHIKGILQSLQSFYETSSSEKKSKTADALRKIDRATTNLLNNPSEKQED